ncbi:hypothetical protein O6H91_01G146800 [Diphasiastrum complanatum]|uniref:Uncharacterized protein n=1 Tax=Diphasiastrum complanatum TaxID=34168 RepID=A0ACC2EX44_DIPCM|nr:hypothetical protein O6H91_01G146800 [Diphasiastrum complanatum]
MAKDGRSVKGKRALCTTILAALLLLSVALLLLLAVGIVGVPSGLSSGNPSISLRLPVASTSSITQLEDGGPLLKTISWQPRAVIYHNFLSSEECDHLINLAKPKMRKSTVVDSVTGVSKDSRVRTSSGMFLSRGHDSVVSSIEKRISQFTFIPIEYGEGLQVLHYEAGQKYEPHYDYFYDSVNTKNGGQRIATVLMYLSDVEAGGETVFPKAQVNSSSIPWWDELSECAKAGLSVRPHKGDALLFWSMTPNATVDSTSLHGGCPVIRGDKWSATKWLRVEKYAV